MMRRRANKSEAGWWWGDVVVAACACVLTVAVVGSGVYLAWRIYDRRQITTQLRAFIASLQNRTAEELQEQAAQLKAKPKLARYVLPELRKALRTAGSEQQVCAAIQIAREFADDAKVRLALFRLRHDPRESVAGSAVEALSRASPPEEAARLLGECLKPGGETPIHATVVDEVCGGLVGLGEAGRREMERQLADLTVERKVWLVRYIVATDPPDRGTWLKMLESDQDEAVRSAAKLAASQATKGGRREVSATRAG